MQSCAKAHGPLAYLQLRGVWSRDYVYGILFQLYCSTFMQYDIKTVCTRLVNSPDVFHMGSHSIQFLSFLRFQLFFFLYDTVLNC